MTEAERQIGSRDEQKERIRKKYKGISADELDVILAKPPDSLYEESKERRVAVYARVSTGDPRQTSSYELQKNHYLDGLRLQLRPRHREMHLHGLGRFRQSRCPARTIRAERIPPGYRTLLGCR